MLFSSGILTVLIISSLEVFLHDDDVNPPVTSCFSGFYYFCDSFFRAILTWSMIKFGLLFSPLLIIVSPYDVVCIQLLLKRE